SQRLSAKDKTVATQGSGSQQIEGLPDLMVLLRQRQQEQQALMQHVMATMQQQLMILSVSTTQSTRTSTVDPSLDRAIATFTYVQDENTTFEAWFKRHESNCDFDAQKLDDAGRVRIFLRKFNAIAYAKYTNYIFPKTGTRPGNRRTNQHPQGHLRT
uniref:DUF7083 domain-containing protein n=1 Tax=Parascaris univalens TaxID=6257 RepID=A0A914ZZ13_PARUN